MVLPAITQEKDPASRLCVVRKISDLHLSRCAIFCGILLYGGEMVWIKHTLKIWTKMKNYYVV